MFLGGVLIYSGADYFIISFSGIYNWLYFVGFNSVVDLYHAVVIIEILAVMSLFLGRLHFIYIEEFFTWIAFNQALTLITLAIHNYPASSLKTLSVYFVKVFFIYLSSKSIRLNYHNGVLIGFFSIFWGGHLIDCSIPVSRGITSFLIKIASTGLQLYFNLSYDLDNHLFGSNLGTGQLLLTFIGGIKSNTASLYLTDITHHQLAVGVLFVWASHFYSSLYKGFGHRVRDVLVSSNFNLITLGSSLVYLVKSSQLQLCLGLVLLSLVTSSVAQQMYSLTPYLYLTYDYVSTVILYIHHSWIASFLIMGSFAHVSLFMIRDYNVIGLSVNID